MNFFGYRLSIVFLVLFFAHKGEAQINSAFTANTTIGCETGVITFSDQSSGGPSTWVWNFGDGGTFTQQNHIQE